MLQILTGAPGTGKTAVIQQLSARMRTMPEPARQVIAELRTAGGDPGQLPMQTFVDLLLERAIQQYQAALGCGPAVVFDRGIPDCAAYALHLGVDPEPSLAASRIHRYHGTVLVLEPWEAIYTTDEERTMTFEMTRSFHDAVLEAYALTGYELTVVPQGQIEERASFIADFMGT